MMSITETKQFDEILENRFQEIGVLDLLQLQLRGGFISTFLLQIAIAHLAKIQSFRMQPSQKHNHLSAGGQQ